ncbi:hypothetical protein CTI12_AA222740 [Artemisia annua]|uniref:Uncharacterized protein n=1 Tax=Artemisia annua TaxID=35608 RepID=A0A2U1MHJ9_ARTAN|nr:hypothetical protein CTI12_AA222740 [Artemisia annua]
MNTPGFVLMTVGIIAAVGLVAAARMVLCTKCCGHIPIDPYTKEELGHAVVGSIGASF